MKYNYKQKFLEDYQIEAYYRSHHRLIWLAGVVFVFAVILSSFAN